MLFRSPQPDSRVLIPEVRFTEVAAGHAFSLAPAWLAGQIPGSLAWCPVVGSPIVRRTWAVWAASSHRRDVGHFIAAFEVPERATPWPEPAEAVGAIGRREAAERYPSVA